MLRVQVQLTRAIRIASLEVVNVALVFNVITSGVYLIRVAVPDIRRSYPGVSIVWEFVAARIIV